MGSWGKLLGFQGKRPWKEGQRGRGPGKDAVSTEGHLLLESPLPASSLYSLAQLISQALPLTFLSSPSFLEACVETSALTGQQMCSAAPKKHHFQKGSVNIVDRDYHTREAIGSDRGGHCCVQRHILKLPLLLFSFLFLVTKFIWKFLMTFYVYKRVA